MVKQACFDSNGMKKGAWSEEEDKRLKDYVEKYGHWNWRLLPKYAGVICGQPTCTVNQMCKCPWEGGSLARCGKSCRLRWVNYLKPGVKRGKFSKQEVNLIIRMHQELGNKWSAMAEKLPGRTDNDIKNYWHAHIHKHVNRTSNKSYIQKGLITKLNDQDSMKAISDEILCVKSIETSGSSTNDHSDSCDLRSENESFWNDPALADLSNIGIEHYFPTLSLAEHQLHLTELSSSNSSDFLPALECNMADGDHGIISPDSLTQPEFEQVSIWDESYCWETDFQADVSYSTDLASQEEEISYDLFRDFDYSMNFL